MIQDMNINKIKNCIICQKEIYKKELSNKQWETKKFCSIQCMAKSPRSLATRQKISETCKAKGVGKWMTGRPRPEHLKVRQREVINRIILEGKHNFYIDGRTKLPCPDCGSKKHRSADKCFDCAIKRKDQHWNWKGGITTEAKLQRHSKEYILWRKAVFERDEYTCQSCGAKNGNGKTIVLHADHIRLFSEFPELRTSIANGRTLCRECHYKRHKKVEYSGTFIRCFGF